MIGVRECGGRLDMTVATRGKGDDRKPDVVSGRRTEVNPDGLIASRETGANKPDRAVSCLSRRVRGTADLCE